MHHCPCVGDDARDRGGRGGQRAREEGSPPLPLAPFEVPIAGADRILSGGQPIVVHRDTHRAARLAPFRARGPEDGVESLGFRLALDLLRARDDEHAHALGDRASAHERRRLPEIRDAGVRAAAEKDDIHPFPEERLAGAEIHIMERLVERLTPSGIGRRAGVGDARVDRHPHPGVGPIRNHRRQLRRVEGDGSVEARPVVARQLPPFGDGGVPGGPLGCGRAAGDVFERGVVRRDQPRAGSPLDRHVAHRHPLFHRERPDRLAHVFEDVARPAIHPFLRDDGEDDVLGRYARVEPAIHAHGHRAWLALQEALGREDVLDLRRADPEGQRAERAVRARVAIAAHDGHAGLGEPHLRSDHVHDPLAIVAQSQQRNAELRAVARELRQLGSLVPAHHRDRPARARDRRRRVIHRRDRAVRAPDGPSAGAQPRERLR